MRKYQRAKVALLVFKMFTSGLCVCVCVNVSLCARQICRRLPICRMALRRSRSPICASQCQCVNCLTVLSVRAKYFLLFPIHSKWFCFWRARARTSHLIQLEQSPRRLISSVSNCWAVRLVRSREWNQSVHTKPKRLFPSIDLYFISSPNALSHTLAQLFLYRIHGSRISIHTLLRFLCNVLSSGIKLRPSK